MRHAGSKGTVGGTSALAWLSSATAVALTWLLACSSGVEKSIATNRETLSPDQLAVLGFERPTIDWSSPTTTLAESTTVTQGAKALAVTPAGWTEINSIQLSSLGQVNETLTLDVFLPAAPSWGEVRVILIAPSLQMWWTELGSQNLAALPAGQYSTVSFPIPGDVRTALAGDYSDLRLKLVVNAEPLASPYLFDKLEIAEGGGSEPPTPGQKEQFSVVIPQGETRQSMFLSAREYLQVDDRVEVNVAGQLTNVAGLGIPGVQFGSAVSGHNNIYSVGNVWLRSQAEVDGFVRTQGIIDKQDGTVVVHGAEQPSTPVPLRTLTWQAEFPTNPISLPVIEQDDELPLAPGAYRALDVHGGRVFLRAGIYYFDSFNTEPQSEVRIENATDPVIVYVKNGFTFKGGFVYESGSREGQVLVGHLGASVTFLQAPFVGTLVAPNGKIELHRPTSLMHKGSWFAREIQVFSDSHILHLPFDWSDLPDGDVPDTDGDGPNDREDACPLDANKTEPGQCGCNVTDVDTDLDLVPDCFDQCRTDPNKQYAGSCGCLNEDTLQPAGVRCVVDACTGSRQESTCDGAGQCGVPECEPTPGNCTYIVFRDSGYWFCDGPLNWEEAEAACNQERGRHLVTVDDRIENLWLSSVLTSDTWLGGNDLNNSGRWYWSANGARDGDLFWLDGLPAAKFVRWASGRPGSDHCLTMRDDGAWVDGDCGAGLGFICEQPVRYVPPTIDIDRCRFYPGLQCPSGDDEPAGDCIDDVDVFPTSRAVMEQMGAECTANCPTEESEGCPGDPTPTIGPFCTGFAAPPPIGEDCDGYDDQEKVFCDLETVLPNEPCSVDDPSCPVGYTCGRRIECAALDAGAQPTPCTSDANCNTGAGHFCATIVPPGPVERRFCIDPNKQTKCDDDGHGGDACVGLCFSDFACGTTNPEACAGNDDGLLLQRCSLTELCGDEPPIETNPLTDPASNLTEQEFPPIEYFPPPKEDPGQYPSAKPPGCGGEGESECNYAVGAHPWCNYTVDQVSERPSGRDVSDSDPVFGDKQGTGSSTGPLSFDFDPNLTLTYNVEEVLPLGDSKFEASAQASATASAHFDLFGVRGDVTLLDALARLDVDRCGLEADAHLNLLGVDFLPALLGDNYEKLDAVDTPPNFRESCEDAIIAYRTAVNRVQKAMRDAEELIRQQKELVANGLRLQPDLCETLLGGDKGLPVNFPSADTPFTGCDGLSPEDTINLFVRYYRQQAFSLITEQQELFPDAQLSLPVPFLDDVNGAIENGDARRETQQIANFTFPIGPIPLNLTIDVFIQYGVAGQLTFTFAPNRLFDAYHLSSPDAIADEIANVDATVTPFAGAGVTVFVGVGFDFGPLSAKVGISGDVSLGVVSLPIYAGAGLRVQPVEDDRPLPDNLQAAVASASDMLWPPGPPKKFRFDASYKFGANARIEEILSGKLAAKLRIKFAFFSKTWKKTIKEFKPLIPAIDLVLIGGRNSSEFADDFGALGAPARMPVPFVDFEELDTPPPLPDLPPDGGVGGSGGSGGAGGMSGAGGSGGRISLLTSGDPRLIPFDFGRVDKFFFDGYCQCGADGATCGTDLDCCGAATCISGFCLDCVAPTTEAEQSTAISCESTEQCCQDAGDVARVCAPFDAFGTTFCQTCKPRNAPAFDFDGNSQADFRECCDTSQTIDVFRGPGVPVCSTGCRLQGESCNVNGDCCSGTCSSGTCVVIG